MDIVNLK